MLVHVVRSSDGLKETFAFLQVPHHAVRGFVVMLANVSLYRFMWLAEFVWMWLVSMQAI
jgi:hypothetical protein